MDTGQLFLVCIGDFINRIVLGKAWPEDDPNWIYLRELSEDGSKKFAVATPLSVLPFLKLEMHTNKITNKQTITHKKILF